LQKIYKKVIYDDWVLREEQSKRELALKIKNDEGLMHKIKLHRIHQ